MTKVNKEEVERISDLASISLTEEEKQSLAQQMGEIITYAERLNDVDTEGVDPMTHVTDVRNVLREDKVRPSMNREDVLRNAPASKDGQFEVPSVLD